MIRLWMVMVLVSVYAAAFGAEKGDAYLSANLPALSREWHGADYTVIAAAIDAGTIPLPRFSDESGSRVLKRMTATQNLALAQSKKLPIENRFQEVLTIGSAGQSILRAYLVAANRSEKVNAELAALLGFQLHLAATQSRITEEFLPTLPRDDKYETRMEGLRLVRTGMTNLFLGATTSLSETSFYSADDISLMLVAMADTLPALKSLFAPDFRSELRKRLEAHLDGATRSIDIENLNKMLVELK